MIVRGCQLQIYDCLVAEQVTIFVQHHGTGQSVVEWQTFSCLDGVYSDNR
jgi:hypothetical protein